MLLCYTKVDPTHILLRSKFSLVTKDRSFAFFSGSYLMNAHQKPSPADKCPVPPVEIPSYMTGVWMVLALLCVLPLFVTTSFYNRTLHVFILVITLVSVLPAIYAGRHRIKYFITNRSGIDNR